MICIDKFHAKGRHYICSQELQESIVINTSELRMLERFGICFKPSFERNPLDWLTKGYCVYNVGGIIQWIDARTKPEPYTIPVSQYGDHLGVCCLAEDVMLSHNILDLRGMQKIEELWVFPHKDINCTIDIRGCSDEAALNIYMMLEFVDFLNIRDDPEREDRMRTFVYIVTGKDTSDNAIKLTSEDILWLGERRKVVVTSEVMERLREVVDE